MNHVTTPPRSIRRHLRFSLRAFLVVVALVGAGFGWLAMRVQHVRRERAAIAAIGKCQVYYDYQRTGFDYSSDDGIVTLYQTDRPFHNYFFEMNVYDLDATPPGPAWLRNWLGDDILANVTYIEIVIRSLRDLPEQRDLAPLAQLTGLEELVLGIDIAPADMQKLLELKNLKTLVLHGLTPASETDLPAVSSHSGLQRLIADGDGWTHEAIRRIGNIRGLKHLSLAHTVTDDNDMLFLRQLTQLESLSLRETAVGDDGLANCAGMSGLTELDLAGTRISDAGLAQLAGLKSLRRLDLGANRISDEGLVILSGLAELRKLGLDATDVTDKTLSRVASLSRLTHLGLNSTHVTNAGLAHLGGLSELEVLELASTDVTNAGLEPLLKLSKLRLLDLFHTEVTYEGVDALKSVNPNLSLHVGARRESLIAPALSEVDWTQPLEDEDE